MEKIFSTLTSEFMNGGTMDSFMAKLDKTGPHMDLIRNGIKTLAGEMIEKIDERYYQPYRAHISDNLARLLDKLEP